MEGEWCSSDCPTICVAPFIVSIPSSPLPGHLPIYTKGKKEKEKENNNIYVGVFAFDHENLPLIMKIKNELCIIKIMLEVVPCEKDFALITIWINSRTKHSLRTLLGFFIFYYYFFYSLLVWCLLKDIWFLVSLILNVLQKIKSYFILDKNKK